MSIQQPCKRWQHLLAARHPDDLTATERTALERHLATCTSCTVTRADYDMLTQHIRTLPAPSLQPLPAFAMPQQEAKAISEHPELDPLPLPERPSSSPRRSRFARTTNALAAALLLVVLIGGSLLLFSHRPQTSTGVPVQVTAEPTHLIPQPLGSCLSDPGLDKICTEGYYKLVHITQKFSGPQTFTVTVDRLYADSNRIAIGFTILNAHGKLPDGLRQGAYAINWFASTQDEGKLPASIGPGFYGDDQTVPYNPKNFTGMMFATFDASSIPMGTKELALHLKAFLQYTPIKPGISTTTDLGTADFEVSMPIHQGYVLHPKPVVVENGMADLSIDNLSISMSETNITLTSQYTINSWRDATNGEKTNVVLLVKGVRYNDIDMFLPSKFAVSSITSLTMNVREPLFNKSGTWKLQITTTNSSGKVIKSATFTFTYP